MSRWLAVVLTPFVLCSVGVGLVHVAVHATPAAKGPAIRNPVASTPESIATGSALYKKYCRFCHGDDAKGNGPQAPKDSRPPDLTDATWEHGSADADLFAIIKDGSDPQSVMKPYGSKMTPQEIWSVVNYLRSLAPKGASR